MDEKGFKKKVMKLLKGNDFFCFATHEPYRAGVPDVYACKNGISFWLELKYTQKEGALAHPLTHQQSAFLRDVNNKGCEGLVIVGLPGNLVYSEKITQVEKRTTFDLDQAIDIIEWIQALSE